MAELYNSDDGVTVEGTAEADSIYSTGNEVSINSYAGNDTITNSGVKVMIDAGADDNHIENSGSDTSIVSGDAKDTIKNSAANVTIEAGDGANYVENSGVGTTILTGRGNDTIYNWDKGSNVTISSGNGDDNVQNHASDVIINASNGKDTLMNWSINVTINGGDGADTIYSGESIKGVEIDGDRGNDTITNWSSNATINGGDGADNIYNGDALSSIFIDGGAGNDEIENWSSSATIQGGDGADSIYNNDSSDNVTIDGGAGDDTIYSEWSDDISLFGGDGNDYIHNDHGDSAIIFGGEGDDTLLNTYGEDVTLSGGEGDDTLTGCEYSETFQHDGGSDVITNYSGEDTIYIAAGKVDTYSFKDSDLIFKVGEGSIKLKNLKNHYVTVLDSSGKTTTKFYGEGISAQEVVKKFVKSMNTGSSDVDKAIKASSNFRSLNDVVEKMVADCAKAGDAEKFLREYCGIFIDNTDTGAAIGWDAGGSSMKTSSDLFPQSGDAVYPDSTTFKKRGLEIKVPAKNTLSAKEQLIVQGLYSWWAEDAIKLIEETYGIHFNGQSIDLSFVNDSDSFEWGRGGANFIEVNMAKSASSNITTANLKTSGFAEFFAHELTHVMQYNFGVIGANYLEEGMADITAGGDNRELDELAGNSTLLAEYLDADNDFSEDSNIYAAGYMFWRYFMRHAYDSTSTSSSNSNSSSNSTDTTTNKNTSIKDRTTKNNSTDDSDESNSTTSTKNNQSQNSTSSNTNKNSAAQNNLNSGEIIFKVDNVYSYSGGDKRITDYQPPEKIQFFSSFSGVEISDENFLVKSDSNKLTIENARDKLINFADGDGNTFAYAYMSNKGGEVASNALGDSPGTFKIIVGAREVENYLLAGDGGSSLIGGKTDDTLQGGVGQDTFIYSSGNDVVANCDSWEKINFAATYTDWLVDRNNLILNAAEGSLRITRARDKMIEVADGDGKVLAHVCMQSTEGTFDARDLNEFVVAVGADNLTNQLIAGDGGSSLWGGAGNISDDMYGGYGQDMFIYKYGEGRDKIFSANVEDIVNLNAVGLEQIAIAEITDGGANLTFIDGGSLNISGRVNTFYVSGQVYHADYENKFWTTD